MEEKENIKDLETEKEEKVETEEVVEEKNDTDTETENKEEEKVEVKEEPKPQVVEEDEEKGNGIPLEEIVTKEYLMEQLNSLNAKFDAVLKENQDLKEKLDDSNGKVKAMQEKYEEEDFGNATRKGVQTRDTKANESFDDYCAKFGK